MVLALAFLALFGVVALAVDLGRAFHDRARLQSAADAAALAAVRTLANGRSWSAAKTTGESVFDENIRDFGTADVRLVQLTEQPPTVQATVQAPARGYFRDVITSGDVLLGVSATAQHPFIPVDVIFVVDVSYSMGIGARSSDIELLKTELGCAFACHLNGSDEQAKTLGARLRIDVARDAVLDSLDVMRSGADNGLTLRAGLVTFSSSVVTNLAPTEELDDIRAAAADIALPANDYQGGTDIHEAFAVVLDGIRDRARSDGTVTYVVLVTDGVENTRMLLPGSVRDEVRDTNLIPTEPSLNFDPVTDVMTFSTGLCDGLKAAGAKLMILNVEYVTDGVGATHQTIPIADTLKPIMAERALACVGNSAHYREANWPGEVRAAAEQLTREAIAKGSRLIN